MRTNGQISVPAGAVRTDDAGHQQCRRIVTTLIVTLERHENDSGVQTMKSVLVEDIKRRFKDMMDEPLFVLATAVDPRYRMAMFDAEQQTKTTALLTTEVKQARQETGVDSPAAKSQRVDDESQSHSKARQIMRELLKSADAGPSASQASATDAITEQVRLFLAQPNIPLESSATSWWRDNAATFPDIAVVARRYLSALRRPCQVSGCSVRPV